MALQPQERTDPADTAIIAGETASDAPDDFDAAFNEFAGKDSQPSGTTTADSDTLGDTETRKESATETSPTPSTTAALSATEQTAQQSTAAKPAAIDWTKAPPEVKAAYDAAITERETKLTQLEQQNIRLRGQVSGLMRKSSKAAPTADGTPSADAGAGTPATRKIDTAKLKKVAEDFPEVAGVVEAVEALNDETERSRAHRESLDAEQREQFFEGNYREVLKQVPDYDALIKTPDGKHANPEFIAWVKAQPEFYQDIVKRNKDDMYDVPAAIRVMTDYKAHRAASSSSQPQGDRPAPSNQAARREQQLSGSIATHSRGGAAASGPTDDFDAAFDYYAAQSTSKGK